MSLFFYRGGPKTEWQLRAEFRRESEARLEEVRALWTTFATARGMRFSTTGPAKLPSLEGRVAGTAVTIAAVGDVGLGFRTRASAEAKIALRGDVRVAPPGVTLWDDLVRLFTKDFFEDPTLDRLLVVRASSRSLARTLLDARVMQTVRTLAPRQLRLSYVSGLIAIEWAGVERDFAVLDDVQEVAAYLAVQGSETAPYR